MNRSWLKARLGPWLVVAAGLMFGVWGAAQVATVADSVVLGHLNAAISWYRHVSSIDQSAGQPSDTLYLTNAKNQAEQAVRLAFDAAAAAASVMSERDGGRLGASEDTSASSDERQNLENAAKNAADHVQQVQTQLADMEKQIASSRGTKRQSLMRRRDALQAELEFDKALQDSMQKIAGFINSSENGQSGLSGKINELKRSVPEVFASGATDSSKPAAGGPNSKATRADNSGMIGQVAYLFTQTRDMHDVESLIEETSRLRANASEFQGPLRDQLKGMVQQGRQAANAAADADPDQIADLRKNLEDVTSRFKRISSVAVPLRQEIVLLDQCHGNLEEWRNSMLREYGQVLRAVVLRVMGILIALGIVFGISALWNRLAYRYVRDVRHRRQVLMIRRFVTGFLIFLVMVLGFVSEFSSLATFAGFLTAGIAVALQTIILSIAAYFSLIGRFGVRVGDRVTISGVTGDVIEIGLVRLHVMEYAGTGIDLYPTGRVVVFSNSVLLAATPLYRQLPGAAYVWHELAMPISPDADTELAERLLVDAVNAVFEQYREDIERQHAIMRRMLDTPIPMPEPQGRMHFTDKGVEFVVRYPVELRRTTDIDDQVTRELMHAMTTHPELNASQSLPHLRAPIAA